MTVVTKAFPTTQSEKFAESTGNVQVIAISRNYALRAQYYSSHRGTEVCTVLTHFLLSDNF